jgi:hypothetical protein
VPDAISIGRNSAESKLGPVATNVRFQNIAEKIPMQTVEMTELLPDVIIQTLLFRARKALGLLIIKFRKIRVTDESVMQILGEGPLEAK